MKVYNSIVIGAGASGLMYAAKAPAPVLLIDHNKTAGRKLLITGAGKCNFSNRNISAANYYSENPHFVKSALAGFTTAGILDMFGKYSVRFEEREDGKLFAQSARAVTDMLIKAAKQNGAEFVFNTVLLDVAKENGLFTLRDAAGREFLGRNLVIAAGGLSYAHLGASGFGHALAAQFGHKLITPRPVLCGLRFGAEMKKLFSPLAGVSCKAELKAGGETFRGDILFTHTGLSGPAVLQCSLYYKSGEIKINFLPGHDARQILQDAKKSDKKFASALADYLPLRLARTLAGEETAGNATKETLGRLLAALNGFSFTPDGSEGYSKAEATAGGVDTKEISSSSMESKKVNNLYFAGEVLDVTGEVGGYNLHWAFASAAAAAKNTRLYTPV